MALTLPGMALSNIIRRTGSQVVPLVARAIGRNQSYHHSALFSVVVSRRPVCLNFCRSSAPSRLRRYATQRSSSDESLLKVLQSEIQYAEESDEQNEAEAAPEGFPFKIEDHAGQQAISLTREYQGETINVEVYMPDLVTGEDEDEDGDDNDGTERPSQSELPLIVRVSKKNGPSLEFGCSAYPDEFVIDSLAIKDPETADEDIAYEGPEFSDLDENLQKAFHKYLEVRGIKPSITNFLHEYMVNKDSREYLMWLKNVKLFIEA